MFWACEHSTGMFEPLNEEDLAKYKRMSKYKKEELAAKKLDREEERYESSDTVQNIECETIN